MAIAQGAGTEIIRCHNYSLVDSTEEILILGEAHHIYTVLSITINAVALQAEGNYIQVKLSGWDSSKREAGAGTGQDIILFKQELNTAETFVWNDKFSFNGFEPLAGSMTAALSTAAEQTAIAAQASAVSQTLVIASENAGDNFDVIITFIDQNNA